MDIDPVFSHIDSSTQIPEVVSLFVSAIPPLSWLDHFRSRLEWADLLRQPAIEQLHSHAKERMNQIDSSQSMLIEQQSVP